ncbi:hypothetical protein L210DRAFT_3160018 [Boletus edulis BED1]|uniref:DUF6533 domain-containing protein n=1 Tax=Boletus edulis BED1 TaxID=1328754 RepID=A0AAD4GHR6_BOLED|nr:hypothetical protein L210DRAFT_3160018 [Boletus edulis BED1]
MSVAEVESYLQISECAIIAAAALLAFDYYLTFGKEVEWIYGTRWTASRIHFVSLRYLPFVAIAMAIPASRVQPPSEADYCDSLGLATNVVYYLCIVLAEAMLIVRTYVFWKCNRRILIGMVSFGSMCMVAAIVVSQTISSQTINPVYKSLNCPGSDSSSATAIAYLCLILYEIGMLGLNWIAFRRMKRHNSPGPLITTLYRDGVMYVAAILAFSVLNAVVSLATPPSNGHAQYSCLTHFL